MKNVKIYGITAVVAVCLLALSGCAGPTEEAAPDKIEMKHKAPAPEETPTAEPEQAPKPQEKPEEAKQPVQLALKFAPQQTATYKSTTQVQRSVLWEGSAKEKPSAFKGGHTGNRAQMTYTEHVKSIDDKGNAAAEITIKDLAYVAKVRDDVTIDFDSSRAKDQNHPLTKLIGQSYTIRMSPAGRVLQVVDATAARAAVPRDSAHHKIASNLLSDDIIQQRHTILALPDANDNRVPPGETWSEIESFSFDMMGAKAYEKVYTLKEVKEQDNQQIAVVALNAVPSSQMETELHKEQATNPFSKMFDTKEDYTGQLKLDLTTGKVQQYTEKLTIEWLIVDPQAKQDQEPAALKMATLRSHSIEKIE
jgi:hypothetical protein